MADLLYIIFGCPATGAGPYLLFSHLLDVADEFEHGFADFAAGFVNPQLAAGTLYCVFMRSLQDMLG